MNLRVCANEYGFCLLVDKNQRIKICNKCVSLGFLVLSLSGYFDKKQKRSGLYFFLRIYSFWILVISLKQDEN